MFIALNCLVIAKFETVWIAVLPLVIALLLALFYQTEKVFFAMFFIAPLSINLEDFGDFGLGMYLPTEPILLGLTILFVFDQLRRPSIEMSFWKHPVTVSIVLYLIWILITSITSVRPEVSFKFLIARIWFFVPVYFYGTQVLSKSLVHRSKLILWLYLIPLTGVVVYTLVRHAAEGFAEDPGHWVMTPFYKDHTSYGALIALFVPVSIGLLFEKQLDFKKRWGLYIITFILLIGLYFSFTRAAWLSLVGGLGMLAIFKFKIHFRYILMAIVLVLGGLASQYNKIIMDLERNKSEHATEDIGERLESVSNISTDASNLERINRWNSAISMWQSKPFFGYGPGTYAMEYAPHQHPKDMTIISSNYGDRGNAHSEYLGALSESGLFGLCFFLSIVFFVFYRAIRLYHRITDSEQKNFILILIVSLTSYFLHSALNNYLDTDKAALPVWGMAAIIVAFDLFYTQKDLESTD